MHGNALTALRGCTYIARHGETVFNAARRLQGETLHTPLTRAGIAQADAVGAALRVRLGNRPQLALWASDTGRALQTLAIVADHLGLDWHDTQTDARLREMAMGGWDGRRYDDVAAEGGPLIDKASGLFVRPAPGGEWYDDVALRLDAWIEDRAGDDGDRLIVMHGLSSRVLRGLLTGAPRQPDIGAPMAPGLPQGSITMIADAREIVIHTGLGRAPT